MVPIRPAFFMRPQDCFNLEASTMIETTLWMIFRERWGNQFHWSHPECAIPVPVIMVNCHVSMRQLHIHVHLKNAPTRDPPTDTAIAHQVDVVGRAPIPDIAGWIILHVARKMEHSINNKRWRQYRKKSRARISMRKQTSAAKPIKSNIAKMATVTSHDYRLWDHCDAIASG